MAYSLIAFVAPNYRDYKNDWLKAYEPGTPTPKAMALDSGGVTQVAKLQLNTDGFLVSAGDALVIPYIDGAYDLWLFPTEAEADANDTSNALNIADDITGVSQASLDANLINDLSQEYNFPTVAAFQASLIEFPDGKIITTDEYRAGFGGGGRYTKITGTGTANTWDIIGSTGVNQSIVLTVSDGRVSTAQLGTNRTVTDYLALIYAANKTAWTYIDVINYSPVGGHVYVDRDDLIIDCLNKVIDFTGLSNAMLVLGEQSNGTISAASRVNIEIRNVRATGDKTSGSKVVFFRNCSTIVLRNWKAWNLGTAFNGDGFPGGPNESIACEFYNMDLRFNQVGVSDEVGSFQGSTFFGGRIEKNDREGVVCKSSNINFEGTIIEGNVNLNGSERNIRLKGGGGFKMIGCYMERQSTNPSKEFISIDNDGGTGTKRVSIIGCDFYGGQGTSDGVIIEGTNWTEGSLFIKDCNINDCTRLVTRTGTPGNWIGSFDYWANAQLDDPSLTLNGATYIENERTRGLCTTMPISTTQTVSAESTKIQATGSAGFVKRFQRFIGRVTVGGAGDWHQVIELSLLPATASTAIRFDLYFVERAGLLQFYTTIVLAGTTSLGTKEDVSGNHTSSLYRINAGFLEVDNLPAANRDWTCTIVATKATLT